MFLLCSSWISFVSSCDLLYPPGSASAWHGCDPCVGCGARQSWHGAGM